LSLPLLVWLTLIIAFISFWWKSDKVKQLALSRVTRHCQQHGLQLLDQSMVLRGVKPGRDNNGGMCLLRRYSFEFTSTGEKRYRGQVSLSGLHFTNLELEAYIIPKDEQDRMQ